MASVRTFDTLGYAKFLVENGFKKEQAEALAEANYEYLVNDLATKEFVQRELQDVKNELRLEISSSENRMMRVNAALIAFAIAAIPIIQVLLSKLN